MMDAATQTYLQHLIRQEGRSLLQYVAEAFPWTTNANQAQLQDVAELVEEEKRMADDLTRFLQRHHGRAAFMGAYPISFTNLNFVSLDHLLPRLVKFEETRIAELTKDLDRILHEETRAKVRDLLEMKKRQVARLKALIAQRAAVG
jgi:hypothetical protein